MSRAGAHIFNSAKLLEQAIRPQVQYPTIATMESPRSERSQTRFSTPVSNLDDHRHQPISVPRIESIGSAQPANSRRNTATSMGNVGPQQATQPRECVLSSDPVSKDFEQAIIDDDKSGSGQQVGERLAINSPVMARRSTGGRTRPQLNRSRESSPSSRSTSPANSVDAFADPRRRERGTTVGSRAPSDLEDGLHRTVSGGTNRRRTGLSNGSVLVTHDDGASRHDLAEDDVCFPQTEENWKTYKIDFEELDEFVAESTRGRPPVTGACRQKLSFSSQGNKPRIFNLLRNGGPNVPKIVTQSASPVRAGMCNCEKNECAVGDSSSILNEKNQDPLGANGPHERRPSVFEASRYSFFSSELEQTIHAADFGDLLRPGETFRDLFELPADGGCWWLDSLNPTEDELHAFQRAFSIHPLTTEDIITQEAREKVELFKQYYFVCFKSFQMDKTSEDYMEPVNVYMVVFREGILTFTYTQSPHAANVRKRIGKLRDYMALTADWICYAMIDNIVDTFGPVITSIEIETDVIEDQVFVARTDDFTPLLRQIGECRKKVMSLMRLLGGKADVIKGFAKRCNDQYSVTPRGEIGLYLGDIQDHVVTMMSNLGHFEKMLSRSHSNYLAQLSVDNIAQGNRANSVLSKITLLASILVPLNLICGLFGMNVPVPGRSSEGLGWFFGIIGVIAAIVLCSLAAARRYRFI